MSDKDRMEPRDDPQCKVSLSQASAKVSLSHSNEAN
jgi:hypothetical protein